MSRVVSVKALEDYRLSVGFDDGTHGIISLGDRLFGPVFEPLRNPAKFREVFVDEFGAIAWPDGADLAPDAIYEQFKSASEMVVPSNS